MKTIWKFPLSIDVDCQTLMLSANAQPLSIKLIASEVMLYVMHDTDTDKGLTPRHIWCIGTGKKLPPDVPLTFIDTVIIRDNLIAHFFLEDRQP